MISAQRLYLQGKKRLTESGCESDAFDAAQLFEYVFGMSRTDLLMQPDQLCAQKETERFLTLIEQRAHGRPLQYLLGKWHFFGRSFFVGDGVLIPREETELLIQTALDFTQNRPECRILDLCAGSGAISVTCACEIPGARVTAVELSEQAFFYLNKNNQTLCNGRVRLLQGDITDKQLPESLSEFELILSNPPYIPSGDLSDLQQEVHHEPQMALDGGEDGLHFYRTILTLWLSKLTNGGMLAVECGIGQSELLADLFLAHDLQEVRIIPDFNGIGRIVTGRKK